MKNSLHLMIGFISVSVISICNGMVHKVHIKNDSSKRYELVCGEKSHELPSTAQRIIPLAWFFSENKASGEANIEFYDRTDPWYAECKKRRFCSLILYCHINKFDKKKIFMAKLERKKPNVATIRDFSQLDLCGLQILRLTIDNNLETAELKFDD